MIFINNIKLSATEAKTIAFDPHVIKTIENWCGDNKARHFKTNNELVLKIENSYYYKCFKKLDNIKFKSNKRKRGETDISDISELLMDISVLFIPFDASGRRFFKANSTKGIKGLRVIDNFKDKYEVKAKEQFISPSNLNFIRLKKQKTRRKKKSKQKKINIQNVQESISYNLNAIVKQECDIFANLSLPSGNKGKINSIQKFNPQLNFSNKQKSFIKHSLKKIRLISTNHKNYPTIIFLSENPTNKEFPLELNLDQYNRTQYIRINFLNKIHIKGLRAVNEMAVYVRKDIDKLISMHKHNKYQGLFLKTEVVVRDMKTDLKGLFQPTKNEYMLKVTLGNRGGYSCTIAGVHLRAKLTGIKSTFINKEWNALQEFCEKHDIQLLIGDFNMDLNKAPNYRGSRGVFIPQANDLLTNDQNKIKKYMGDHSTVFLTPMKGKKIASDVMYSQQYSNSVGTEHFMGYYVADKKGLHIIGTDIYGRLGASGSRYKKSSKKYYSDHPSIYVCLNSTRYSDKTISNIKKLKRRDLNHEKFGINTTQVIKIDKMLNMKKLTSKLQKNRCVLPNSIFTNEPSLMKRDKNLPYGVAYIPGDGNCLFRSVSQICYGDQDSHRYLRHCVCNYMHKNLLQFENYNVNINYLNRLSKSGAWGGYPEIITLSILLNRNIVIYKPNRKIYMKTGINVNNENSYIYLLLCNYENPNELNNLNHFHLISSIQKFLNSYYISA